MFRLFTGIAVLTVAIVQASNTVPANYFESIREWQKQRDAGLRSEDGWLTLAGLFWLKPGDNTIGSADSNNFVLPKGSAPAQIGRLRLEGERVIFTTSMDHHALCPTTKINRMLSVQDLYLSL